MAYREGIIKETEFFTTAELAQKLKMNVQVITRKIQAGEISAYKIGKDWRIPEQSVYSWLEEQSNQTAAGRDLPEKSRQTTAVKAAKPDQRSKRRHLLEYILAQFEPERIYTENELNMVIARYHNDFETIRGEFLTENMIDRIGHHYRRRAGYRFTD